jgi:putative hemolysin
VSINNILKKANYTKKVIYINTSDFFKPTFDVKLADSKNEIKSAQKLRYQVFFSERNKKKIFNIDNFRKDSDKYDNYCDHIVVIHKKSKFSRNKIVGTYRLLKQSVAENKSGFYSSEEYDLTKLLNSNKYFNMLELSRSCISKDFRNKNVLQLMWKEIYKYIENNKVDAMFGTASFLDTNLYNLSNQLIYLNNSHKMPNEIMVNALDKCRAKIDYSRNIKMNLKLVKSLPTLIKGYLKLNAYIGDGAVVDHKFKTTDIFVFLPVNDINYQYVKKII